MKKFMILLLLIGASTAIAQTQKSAASDNRTYAVKEVDEKPELEGAVTFADYFKKHFKSPSPIVAPLKLIFTIEKNGLALNPRLPQDTDQAIVKEVKRVLKSAPKWKPAKKDGHAVRTTYDFTIR